MAKFKTLADLVTAMNNGSPLKAAVTMGMWKKGDKIVVQQSTAYINGQYAYVVAANGQGYNLTLSQVDNLTETKEEIQKTITSLEESIKLQKAKLKYLESTKQDNFEDTEFKVWNTLQLIKGKTSDLEKAKAIAALINS